ncbi:hypothetical protein STANM309S_05933 [Streptomyces tanashiensis]
MDSKPLSDVVQPVMDVEGLFCAPATIDLAGAEIELVSLVARESRLQRAIQAYEQPLDYILIDCPPSLGLLTVNAMVAGAEVLIPIQCEYYALEGLGQLLRNVDLVRGHLNPALHVSTILRHVQRPDRLASQVAEECAAISPRRCCGPAFRGPSVSPRRRATGRRSSPMTRAPAAPSRTSKRPVRSLCGGSPCSTTHSTPMSGTRTTSAACRRGSSE